ncbi:hypothetical protein GCM10023210_39630 [Chryseobacterium ginsengisoli]|uniref:Uncharacterized protein n=1 Tax=Chryseobacterium ginsengisoli TaxID=363853 RepID=A0ABP9MT46_9FLAO
MIPTLNLVYKLGKTLRKIIDIIDKLVLIARTFHSIYFKVILKNKSFKSLE